MIKKETAKKAKFPLEKENYILLIIAVIIVIIGFIIMSGGGSNDPNTFNEDIYGFRRTKLAPVITLCGFIFAIYAIMKKPKKAKDNNQAS
jgi:uncharacterized membrane protein YidH (DUF202 family)